MTALRSLILALLYWIPLNGATVTIGLFPFGSAVSLCLFKNVIILLDLGSSVGFFPGCLRLVSVK